MIYRHPEKETAFRKVIRACFPAIVLCLLLNGTASAHKVTIFARVEGDTVHGATKFSGGRPAVDAEIVVTDPDGNRLLTTRTDDQGEFSFPVPRKSDLRIQLLAGTGHQGEWTIRAEEIGAEGVIETGPSTPPTATAPPSASSETSDSPGLTGMSPEALQSIIEAALDKKLKPVIKMMADAHDPGPSVTEIIGGIGYIFGLMGVGMYFLARRKIDPASRP